MTGLRWRAAVAADAAAVRALIHAALREHGLDPAAYLQDRDLDDLEASYGARGGLFEVALDPAGAVVGSLGMYPLDPGPGGARVELRKMYLAPAWRGRGQGRALLERALAWARARGYARVELETASALGRAVALYRAAGFREVPHRGAGPVCEKAFVIDIQ